MGLPQVGVATWIGGWTRRRAVADAGTTVPDMISAAAKTRPVRGLCRMRLPPAEFADSLRAFAWRITKCLPRWRKRPYALNPSSAVTQSVPNVEAWRSGCRMLAIFGIVL